MFSYDIGIGRRAMGGHTEESLAGATILDDLDHAGLQLFNGGNVVGQDTHISRLGGDVDLDDALRLVDGLCAAYISSARNCVVLSTVEKTRTASRSYWIAVSSYIGKSIRT